MRSPQYEQAVILAVTAFLLLHRGQVHNQKHKAILYLTFSSGLRVSEVVRLRQGDIDVDRYLDKVRQVKGRKDSYSILSQSALDVLNIRKVDD
ncbi:tyrosine-type recombinase/integrase [Paenibacillus lactis]|uniref:tyrosine-type recombinase/integrase n=1 Tax=Paenibacillus lactis TaxID=228574 RepID=UPI0021B50E90